MEQITLGDLASWLAFIAALGGSIVAIVHFIKKALKSLFKEQTSGIDKRFDKLEAKLNEVDLESGKNFLVTILGEVERGEVLDQTEIQRFYEQYEHYLEAGGNSYIRHRFEELQKQGKI